MRIGRHMLAWVAALTALTVTAAPPSWWTTNVVAPNALTNDFAAVNAGQVKWLALRAHAHLQAVLPGGAGTNLDALVAGFSFSNNYAAVKAGQLKTLATPFFNRLIAVGYTNAYPWTATTSDDVNFAAVNIGQAKHIFAFDLATDTDADGLPDWWERHHFGDLDETGTGDTDGDGLKNMEEYELGTDPNNPADASALLETARRTIVDHWHMVMDTELTFTNAPGSSADLEDLRNALNNLSGKFYTVTP